VLKVLKYLMPAVSMFAVTGCALLGMLGGASSSGPSSSSQGAAAGGTAIPPPSIFDQVEKSTPVGLMAPAALLDDNPRLESDIVNAQCKFRTADPPFFVPKGGSDNANWDFVGRLNDRVDGDHEVREMDAMEYRSFFGFGWPKQQLNTWPVDMVTLSEMPKIYLDQRLAMMSKVKLDAAQEKELASRYIDDSQKIQDTVRRLESTYNPDVECLQQ
jgi:hypothetical protein